MSQTVRSIGSEAFSVRRRAGSTGQTTASLARPAHPARARKPVFLLLMAVVLVFQFSALPDTLGIKPIGRVLNTAALVVLCVLSLRAFAEKRMARSWFFVIPVALLFVGYAMNFLRGFSIERLGQAGALISWAAALSVPFMRSYSLEKAWAMFYRFMFLFAVVACVEYAAVFSGRLAVTPFVSQNGYYLRGICTVFNERLDGSVDGRMYGVFAEPGTFAMFLLPAIAYALVFGKRLSLLVFLVCMWWTGSFGGEASLVVVVILFIQWKTRRRLVGLLVLPFVMAGAYYLYSNYFTPTLATTKSNSAMVRQDQVELFGAQWVETLTAHPLGMDLPGGTTNLQADRSYIGSNFTPYVALASGGVVAFAGYLALLVLSLASSLKYFARYNPNPLSACAFISLSALLLFVFQRETILESALFAFLFATPIIEILRRSGTAYRSRLEISTSRRTWSGSRP